MMHRNVLLPMALPTQDTVRTAVAQIMRAIQRDHDETDVQTAAKIDVSPNTVANARNRLTDLKAITIARIGAVYGEGYVDPYHALYGARGVPASAPSVPDLMPCLTALAAKLAVAGAVNHLTVQSFCTELDAVLANVSAVKAYQMKVAA
jgi:DNA-binding Lrp family transcriptional regulator